MANAVGETKPTDFMVSIPKGRVVDLSHRLYPGAEQYTLEVTHRGDRNTPEGDIMSSVYMWSHVGTHVEAMLHFLWDGTDAAGLAIDRLMGPAIVLDFRTRASMSRSAWRK